MTMMRRVPAVTAAVFLLAAPTWAQGAGAFEVGAYARVNEYDNSLGLDNSLGVGGRLGAFVYGGLAVEAALSRTSSGGVTHTPLHVSLAYNVPAGASAQILVGAGYVRNKYGGDVDITEDGVSGFVALRVRLRNVLALRIDAVEDFIGHPANQSPAVPYNGNLGVHVGLSLMVNVLRPAGGS